MVQLSGLDQCIIKFWLSDIQLRYKCAHSAKSGEILVWKKRGVPLLSTQMIFNPVVLPQNARMICIFTHTQYLYSHLYSCMCVHNTSFIKTKSAIMSFINTARRQVLSIYFFLYVCSFLWMILLPFYMEFLILVKHETSIQSLFPAVTQIKMASECLSI